MEATEVADDLLTQGWVAPAAVGPDPRDFERAISLTIAQANVIHERDETITDLRRRLAAAEKERDEAVDAGFRERSTRIRTEKVNTEQRGRLDALTRANHSYGHGRRSLAGRFGSWAR